jgi:hypothetical protein
MAGSASKHIDAASNGMSSEVRQQYAVKTGELVRGVEIVQKGPLFKQVRSKAKYAAAYEFGSVARHTNAGAYRGTMPPKPTFVPSRERHRTRMFERFEQLIKRIKVRGMTGSAA